MVFLVRLEVLRKVVDPCGQQRNLNLRRPRVALVKTILFDDLLLRFLCNAHA